jgi:uncharacterized membrane-anchored protein
MKLNTDTSYTKCGKKSMHLFHQKAERKKENSVQNDNPWLMGFDIQKFYIHMIS